MTVNCRCTLVPVIDPPGTVTVEPPAVDEPVIETEPGTTEITGIDVDHSGGGKWHWTLRSNARRGVCGAPVDPKSRGAARSSADQECKRCDRIMRLWLEHQVWEGYGPPPGRELTAEFRFLYECDAL